MRSHFRIRMVFHCWRAVLQRFGMERAAQKGRGSKPLTDGHRSVHKRVLDVL